MVCSNLRRCQSLLLEDGRILTFAFIGLAVLMVGCTTGSATAPSGVRPAEFVQNPPTYSGELPGLGQVVLRFVQFQPARGGPLTPGEGAYVNVDVTLPDEKLMVGVWAEAWDGQRTIATSFWPSGSAQFVCPRSRSTTKHFLMGYDHSKFTRYPTPSDPDVPFVRVKVVVSRYEQACAPPTVIAGDPTPPVIDVVERLDWHRAK